MCSELNNKIRLKSHSSFLYTSECRLVHRVWIIKYDIQTIQVFYMSEHHIARSVNDEIQWKRHLHLTRHVVQYWNGKLCAKGGLWKEARNKQKKCNKLQKRFGNQWVHGPCFLSLITFWNYSVLYVLLGYFKIEDWLLQITCWYGQGYAGTWCGAKLYLLYRPTGLYN